MNLIFSIMGLIGGLLCCIGDLDYPVLENYERTDEQLEKLKT